MHYCFVPHCNSRLIGKSELKFHRFPNKIKQKRRFQEWLEKLGLKNEPHGTSMVCGLHFDKADYVRSLTGKSMMLKNDAFPTKNLPGKDWETIPTLRVRRTEQREQRQLEPNTTQHHAEQLFLPTNVVANSEEFDIEIKIESDSEEETNLDILTRFKCGFCTAEYSNPADVKDHIEKSHGFNEQKPSTSSKQVETVTNPSIPKLTDREMLSELLTRLENFDWCSCKVCVAHCQMFFDHITSTHSNEKLSDKTNDITTQKCYICPICEVELDFENVLEHMQKHDANTSNAMEIEPAPNGSLDDHGYSSHNKNNSNNLNTEQAITEKKEISPRIIDRSKDLAPGIFRRMKIGKTVKYVFNNDIESQLNPAADELVSSQWALQKVPPLPILVKRKINTILKSESKEKIMEYQCVLCGNIHYRKDAILKCLAAHRANGWMDFDVAVGEDAVTNTDSEIISLTPILPETMKNISTDLQQDESYTQVITNPEIDSHNDMLVYECTEQFFVELPPISAPPPQFLYVCPNTALKCAPCGRIFSSLQEIEDHARSHHDTNFVLMRTEDVQICHTFKCTVCKDENGQFLVFNMLEDTIVHRSAAHKYYAKSVLQRFFRRVVIQPDSNEAVVTGDLPYYENDCIAEEFQCVCKVVYTTKPKAEKCYWKHIGIKRFKCLEHRTDNLGPCDMQFYTKDGLHSHEQRVHVAPTVVPRIVCSTCGKNVQQTRMNQHVRQAHSLKPNLLCVICGKTYCGELQLRQHIKVVHKRKQRYQCNVCFKRFDKKSNVELCTAMHRGGVKNFHCVYCEKSFYTRFQQKSHAWQYHKTGNNTPVELYSCVICNYSTRSQKQLDRHKCEEHGGCDSEPKQIFVEFQ